MSQDVLMRAGGNPQPGSRDWLHVLWIGLLLFVTTTIVMFLTQNPNLYPTVILVGNFLVPVVFVTFLYDHQHLSSLTAQTIIQSFFLGGILGVLGASILEPLLIAPPNLAQGPTFPTALAIGLIEEGCKLGAVILLARRMQRTGEIDGLLLGAAVGMGFAALESTGFAFTAFLASRGQVGFSIVETIVRGLIAPLGHGVWTSIVGAVLFRTKKPARIAISGRLLLAYLFVSLLHGLWDGFPHTLYVFIPPGIPIPLIPLMVGIVGLLVLALLYRQSVQQPTEPVTSTNL